MGMSESIIYHRNTWYWGRSTHLVGFRGLAIVSVSVEDEKPRIAWIHGLSVHISARARGYGRKMLEAAISEAKKMGAKEVELAAEQNTFPERWYRRMGFEERRTDEKLVIFGKQIKEHNDE